MMSDQCIRTKIDKRNYNYPIRALFSVIILFGGTALVSGCASNNKTQLEASIEVLDNPNIFYEQFIEVYLREHAEARRADAESIIYETFLKNMRSVSEVLSEDVVRIRIEVDANHAHLKRVAVFSGDSEEAQDILSVLNKGKATIGKRMSNYTLCIYFKEQSEPVLITVQNDLFRVEDEGIYCSGINLEAFLVGLVEKGGSRGAEGK